MSPNSMRPRENCLHRLKHFSFHETSPHSEFLENYGIHVFQKVERLQNGSKLLNTVLFATSCNCKFTACRNSGGCTWLKWCSANFAELDLRSFILKNGISSKYFIQKCTLERNSSMRFKGTNEA